MRPDDRVNDALRPLRFERQYTKFADGAVLVSLGETKVLCTASVSNQIPGFLQGSGGGWVTAEYNMLPGSTPDRVPRDAQRRGRAMEISRFIGRSLRPVVDLYSLGERQITVDCDVLQADGGTRTAAITGGFVALHDACSALLARKEISHFPILHQCAAISVGIVEGEGRLDLDYQEDFAADVDMNVAMQSNGDYLGVQGASEGESFSRRQMDALLDLAEKGVNEIFELQRAALGLT